MRKLLRQKSLDKIGIQEICDIAEIGRRTFYRYYPDKYALFEDTYHKEYYNNLGIDADTGIYDIYGRIIRQMYEDQEFFSHAIAIKGQNGFWEIITELIYPRIIDQLSSDALIDRAKDYYTRNDIQISLYMIEEWIKQGYRKEPDEMLKYIRLNNAVHGKWQYQIAMGQVPDEYSLEDILESKW